MGDQKKYDFDEQSMYSNNARDPIFSYIADNLRNELIKLNSSLEYAQLSGDVKLLDNAKFSSQAMLRLIDCYLSYTTQADSFSDVEPVSLSAMLTSIASTMSPYAAWQQCDLDLNVMGKYQPVMVNRELLKTVLTSLSSIFISAQSEIKHTTRPIISYAVTRTKNGITAGIYSNVEAMNGRMLRTARMQYGKPGNPTSAAVTNASAGLYMADSLLSKISNGLKASRFNKMVGLSASFEPSQQLAIV